MKTLRAFVGHSFTTQDEHLVGKFLKYLDAIQELNPHFTWQHAERPEPSRIDDKVLKLFEDKNVFIGICTRKEMVLQASGMRPAPLLHNWKIFHSRDVEWKTSDWVIQEIGLAYGRGLNVILLVEEGVRSPGGIQGTLEYIPFSREAPEESFAKLLHMIASLSADSQVSEAPESGEPATLMTDEKPGDADWLIPDHRWHRDSYELAYMHYIAIDDDARAAEIEASFLASAIGSSDEERASWSAFSEYIRISFGRGGRIEKIAAIAAQYTQSAGVLRHLALAHNRMGEQLKAAEIFILASRLSSSPVDRINLLGEAVQAAAEKDVATAQVALSEAKAIASGQEALESLVLTIENEFSKTRNEPGFLFAAMERLLEQNPDDHSKRFELAYAYSDAGMADMAMYHYSRIPYGDRTEMAWNNLGVSYENQKLASKAVWAYRRSVREGGTLAASNLAHKYLGAGFVEEAREIAETAANVADHHKNVDSVLAQIKGVPEKESEEEKKMISSSQDVSMFYKKMGAALAVNEMQSIDGKWLLDGVELRVDLRNGQFTAIGTTEETSAGLRRLVPAGSVETVEIVIRGVARGRAVYGTYEKKKRGGGTLLGMWPNDEKETLALFLSPDANEMTVLRGEGEKRRTTSMTLIERVPLAKVAG